jgi:hypothetical protein
LQRIIRDVVAITIARDAQVTELTEENDRLHTLIKKFLSTDYNERLLGNH